MSKEYIISSEQRGMFLELLKEQLVKDLQNDNFEDARIYWEVLDELKTYTKVYTKDSK